MFCRHSLFFTCVSKKILFENEKKNIIAKLLLNFLVHFFCWIRIQINGADSIESGSTKLVAILAYRIAAAHSIVFFKLSSLLPVVGVENGRIFAREHPLSCLLLGLLYTYPGGLLANCLLAKPLLSFLLLSNTLYATLLAWYLVFYSPQDFFYRQATGSSILLPL